MEMTARMIRINKGLALAASLTVVVVGLGTGVAFAATENDTDNISPASTAFTASNSGNITFNGSLDGVSYTVTCTSSSLTATTPASGLGPVTLTNPPSFSGCTDNHGGTDTIMTSGTWTLKFIDLANDEGISIGSTTDEPAMHAGHSGDSLQITIPAGGGVFTTTALRGCTLTTKATTITGAYDDVNTVTFSGATINVSASGCFASNPTQSGKYSSNQNFQDVSS